MFRLLLDRTLLRISQVSRANAFCPEVSLFSTKPNQAVIFTRGDGTAMRFYKHVSVGRAQGKDSAYTILLDGNVLKTPAGQPLMLPNRRLAMAIAAEWEWQDSKRIQPGTMPMMTLASTATDQPKPRDKIIAELLKYVNTDVVLCRDDPGTDLAKQQEQVYRPLVAWANRFFNVELSPSSDLLYQGQSVKAQGQIHNYLAGMDTWRLIIADALIGGCRSVVIGAALLHDQLTIKEAMRMSRLEEEYQIEHWGLVEGAHDLDIADLKSRLSTSKLFMKWLRS